MNPINIKRNVYAMASVDGQSAEITMYGDIYENTPRDWWTGEPIEGQFITLETFLADLKAIQGCTKLTIRMNSYGGDAGASNTIHNRLRELARNGVDTLCIVDGAAMSGGSLIMSACNTVIANPSSIIMIHLCWNFIWGGYNANELRKAAGENDAWDKMQVECYKRKTGMSDEEILGMMTETTYMTGREAMEKGFVDELLEDATPTTVAASAKGNFLFVNGRKMHLAPGMTLPEGIPTVNPEETPSVQTHTTNNEGGNPMTLEQLQAAHPELVAQIQASAQSQVTETAQAERERIQSIDAIGHLFSAEQVEEAKYGEKPCTAQELTYRAAQAAAKAGGAFLKAMEQDTANSGGQNLTATTPPQEETDNSTPEAKEAEAKALVQAALHPELK